MSGWQQMTDDQVYRVEQIEQRLAEQLPQWQNQEGRIQRRYKTHDWKSTLMVVNAIGHLAEAANHHPELAVSYASVIVKLMTHSATGVTNKDFALADKIEQVIHWQPGREEQGLEGRPSGPDSDYVKYD